MYRRLALSLRIVPVLATLLIAACATPATRVAGAGGPIDPRNLESWQAAGRIGVVADGRGGSGAFDWRQSGDRSEIHVNGPVGIGAIEVALDGDGIEVATSDGRHYADAAARRELEARLGTAVPAHSLRYWLVGLPAPGPYQWTESEHGEPVLEQSGWRIEYSAFADAGGGRLPAKLTATAGRARIKLLVERWSVDGGT
jgi:outer membrane lipoprotein LolB